MGHADKATKANLVGEGNTAVTITQSDRWQIEWYDARTEIMVPAEALQKEADSYAQIGMTSLSTKSRICHSFAQGILPGHRLASNELAVWEWRYPSVYWNTKERTFPEERARAHHPRVAGQRSYGFQVMSWPVPMEIREVILHAMEVFPLVEVWTPELDLQPLVGPSPIVIGWHRGDGYILARWAEALEPWEELQKRSDSREAQKAMRWRRRALMNFQDIFPVCLCCLGVVTLLGFLVSPWFFGVALLGGIGYFDQTPNRARQKLRKIAKTMGWIVKERT
jgi:hypothetical protein